MKSTITITVDIGVPLEVTGNYIPEVPMVWYYSDGSGYPGDPAEIEITNVMWGDIDITDLVFDTELLEIIYSKIYDNDLLNDIE